MPRDGTKLALFIDGINTHAAARALGFDIDYKSGIWNVAARALTDSARS
jgi:hypothetical protein